MINKNFYPVSGFDHPCSGITGHDSRTFTLRAVEGSSFYLEQCGTCGAVRRMARYTRGGGYRTRLSNGLGGCYPRR